MCGRRATRSIRFTLDERPAATRRSRDRDEVPAAVHRASCSRRPLWSDRVGTPHSPSGGRSLNVHLAHVTTGRSESTQASGSTTRCSSVWRTNFSATDMPAASTSTTATASARGVALRSRRGPGWRRRKVATVHATGRRDQQSGVRFSHHLVFRPHLDFRRARQLSERRRHRWRPTLSSRGGRGPASRIKKREREKTKRVLDAIQKNLNQQHGGFRRSSPTATSRTMTTMNDQRLRDRSVRGLGGVVGQREWDLFDEVIEDLFARQKSEGVEAVTGRSEASRNPPRARPRARAQGARARSRRLDGAWQAAKQAPARGAGRAHGKRARRRQR